MAKILIVLVGIAMTWGLVATFGWMTIPGCFLLALATLVFSTESQDVELAKSVSNAGAHYFSAPTTYMGNL